MKRINFNFCFKNRVCFWFSNVNYLKQRVCISLGVGYILANAMPGSVVPSISFYRDLISFREIEDHKDE